MTVVVVVVLHSQAKESRRNCVCLHLPSTCAIKEVVSGLRLRLLLAWTLAPAAMFALGTPVPPVPPPPALAAAFCSAERHHKKKTRVSVQIKTGWWR